MAESSRTCEFFLLRYVPDAVKDEFVNIGVLLVESRANGAGAAEVRFTRDWQRVRCLDPNADIAMLEALEKDIRAYLATPSTREQWLARLLESCSNSLQLSAPKACLTDSPAEEITRLAQMYLDRARPPRAHAGVTGRRAIFYRMRDAFERAGVWDHLHQDIAAELYTFKGDPLCIDCGYRPNGVLKMFHAVSLATDVDAAKVLAFSFPQLAAGVKRDLAIASTLTAVVEDALDRDDTKIAFALATLEQSRIAVAPVADLPQLAEEARRELRL